MRKSKDYYKAIILLVVIAFSSALNSQDNLYTLTFDKSKLTQSQADSLEIYIAKITKDYGVQFTVPIDQITFSDSNLSIG